MTSAASLYYNARYYDATIGRFISPDTVVPNPADPQCYNRYSYCLNNPLKYTDPSGYFSREELNAMGIFEENTCLATWSLLREAEVGDKLTVELDDGTRETYYFTQEYSGDFENYESGDIVLSQQGKHCDVSEIIESDDNSMFILEKKRPQLSPFSSLLSKIGFHADW